VEVTQRLGHSSRLIERDLTDDFGTRELSRNGDGWKVRSELDPRATGRANRRDDQAVDPLGRQTLGQRKLFCGIAIRIRQQRVQTVAAQLALDRMGERLMPKVGKAANEQTNRAGPPATQCASHWIGDVAELVGFGLNTLDRGCRHPFATQCIRHCRHR
jgi:hypothetical protein